MHRRNKQREQEEDDPHRAAKLYIITGIAGVMHHIVQNPDFVQKLKKKVETHAAETSGSEEGNSTDGPDTTFYNND